MPARHAASKVSEARAWEATTGGKSRTSPSQGEAARTDWSLPPQLWLPVNRLARLPVTERGRGGFFFSQALFPENSNASSAEPAEISSAAEPKSGAPIETIAAPLHPRGDARVTRRRRARTRAADRFHPTPVSDSRLRQLARQILVAQEDERRDLSREILNEVVQTLVGIEAELLSLGTDVGRVDPGLQSRTGRSQRLLESSIRALHRLAGDLRPTALDDLGLIPALHAYSRDFASANDLRIHLIAYGAFSGLSEDMRTAIFRVAQESLADALHYARATEIRLQIFDEGSRVRLEVSDNGRADPPGDAVRHQLGILSMTERVEMLGGRLSLGTSPDAGNVVRVILPRPNESAPR
ncbi:MAG TPA: ATP-binding protein [Candidatus Didemnitutus sp.]|nr:ATP-binding protein [Candidatus Didemnitutus sp.]